MKWLLIYIHTYILAHIHTYVHTYEYIHTYTHTYIHMYVHTYTYTHTYIHACMHTYIHMYIHTRSDNKVRKLIAVKVLYTSLLNTTVVAFKVLPLGSYTLIPAPSPPFKRILELVLWNVLQRAAIVLLLMSSKCLPFNISFIFGNRKK